MKIRPRSGFRHAPFDDCVRRILAGGLIRVSGLNLRDRSSFTVTGPEPRGQSRPRGSAAYMMIEALVYIGLVMVILGAGYVAMYRCIDNSVALRRSADDISRALQAGERWRADVRAVQGVVRLEDTSAEPTLYLPSARGEVAYRFASNAVLRRMGDGNWVRLLANVKTSAMSGDARKNVAAWQWELELQPQFKGTVKPGRLRPLFTFLAVPINPRQP